MNRMWKTRVAMVIGALTLAGCTADVTDEVAGPSGDFVPAPDDEILDPADPPTDPDPETDEANLAESDSALSSQNCPVPSSKLSPVGLTFVIHVSKHEGWAKQELGHLEKIKNYLRARDIFMIEGGSPIVAELRQVFPCNRFHFIAYPSEMPKALGTGEGIDGIAIDWEGANVTYHSQAWTIDKLSKHAKSVHAKGKLAGFVPAWGGAPFDDAKVLLASSMDYELSQIQGACVKSASNFAGAAKSVLNEVHQHKAGLRRFGFEISMDSFPQAPNHVGPARAAECTRKAYGKGARAIYIYGNGQDHLVDYFHRLGKLGLRKPN